MNLPPLIPRAPLVATLRAIAGRLVHRGHVGHGEVVLALARAVESGEIDGAAAAEGMIPTAGGHASRKD